MYILFFFLCLSQSINISITTQYFNFVFEYDNYKVKYELENNSCEVCGEIPAIVVGINEYKRKGKDFEKPLLHYIGVLNMFSIL